MSTENKEPTKEATEAQANRIVAALEEILAVAIERGGVAREESYSDDEFHYPAFRDSEFNRLVLHSWTRKLNELSGDLEHNAEKLALQLDLLFVWLQDLRKELKPPISGLNLRSPLHTTAAPPGLHPGGWNAFTLTALRR